MVGSIKKNTNLYNFNHVATMLLHFMIPCNLIDKQIDHTKSLGEGLRTKYLLLCCCIWDMQNEIVLKKMNFDLLGKWGVGVWGKILATTLLNFVIPINLICNMTIFWKS